VRDGGAGRPPTHARRAKRGGGRTINTVTVIIVNWNTADLARRCIESVAATTSVPWEIVVVDNASSDDSVTVIRTSFPWVRLVQNSSNLGFARANNQVLRAAGAEFVLLLNPDTVVHNHAIDGMVGFLRERPRAAAVGCMLLNEDGSLQPSCRSFPSPLKHLAEVLRLPRLCRHVPILSRQYVLAWKHDEVRAVDWVSGAALMMRQEAIRDVGVLDEDYFMYGEELDWCFRARRRGWLIYYMPDARVTHLGGRSTALAAPAMFIHSYRSTLRFYRKFYSPAAVASLRLVIALRMAARAVKLLLLGPPDARTTHLKACWTVLRLR
jgi:N-acetylglucosaminyl-diphospho-decaprenol L-rhamnosyltransferase